MPISNERKARQFQGMISAAIAPGTTHSHLRAVLQAGRNMGHPVKPLYDEAAEAARQNRRLDVPTYEELMIQKDGAVS